MLIGLLVVGLAGPADAAPTEVSSPVEVELTVAGNITNPANVVFQGTVDEDTGDLVGKLLFEIEDVAVTEPIPAELQLQVTQPEDGIGKVDLATNEATFTATLVLNLYNLLLNGEALFLTPCSYTMPVELIGTYDPATKKLTLGQEGFAAAATAGEGAARCGGLGPQIDDVLVGSNNSISAVMDLAITNAAPPVQEPPAPPAPDPAPAPAPAAAPVAAAAPLTG